LFGGGVEITFQNVFHLEMHYNNIYFKKLFLTLIYQNNPKVQKKMNLKKKSQNHDCTIMSNYNKS
jgi:hypothetical protein